MCENGNLSLSVRFFLVRGSLFWFLFPIVLTLLLWLVSSLLVMSVSNIVTVFVEAVTAGVA